MTNIFKNAENLQKKIDIDHIILKLTKEYQLDYFILNEDQINGLCDKSKKIFAQQPNLLELLPPINVCGDIHGQFFNLMTIFQQCGYPENQSYLFLGDYIDRGCMGLQCICLLMAYKIKYPLNFFLIRGNHQSCEITKIYGFYDECKKRSTLKTWQKICNVFNYLPIAAIIGERIFCAHGGISPFIRQLSSINKIPRPIQVAKEGIICDILWSDPMQGLQEWIFNVDRGISYNFGEKAITKFLKKFDLDFICRSHQVVEDGYQFFADKKLLTIFSAPNYCGTFENDGGVLIIDQEMMCSVKIIKSNVIRIKKRKNKPTNILNLRQNYEVRRRTGISPYPKLQQQQQMKQKLLKPKGLNSQNKQSSRPKSRFSENEKKQFNPSLFKPTISKTFD